MLRSDQILATVEMIQKENLDVRTVTMGAVMTSSPWRFLWTGRPPLWGSTFWADFRPRWRRG
ncbi:MAG: hypothetical protein P8X86_13285 [Desulfofustis sp.]